MRTITDENEFTVFLFSSKLYISELSNSSEDDRYFILIL